MMMRPTVLSGREFVASGYPQSTWGITRGYSPGAIPPSLQNNETEY